MVVLTLICGAIVGLSLGLTGGGGSIFAVPLLVHVLGVSPADAVGVSLGAVGVAALMGLIPRLARGEVEIKTGLLFAAAGIVGAPIGSAAGSHFPGELLLEFFACLMIFTAARMWRSASRTPESAKVIRAPILEPEAKHDRGPACSRDPRGVLRLTSRCMLVLLAVGLGAGVLSGLFGIGGGFVIVPALVMFTGMGIHRAVATSLLVISLVSVSAISTRLVSGLPLPLTLTYRFALGAAIGMLLGTMVGRAISGAKLQKAFAVAILLVAAFVIVKQVV